MYIFIYILLIQKCDTNANKIAEDLVPVKSI